MEKYDLLKKMGWSEELINITKEISELVQDGAINLKIKTVKPLNLNHSESASTISLKASDISSGSDILIT